MNKKKSITGAAFVSPNERKPFSDIAPKYLGGLDIDPYTRNDKLLKFAKDND